MSIEELFTFMREELKGCPGYAFLDRGLADLRKAMEKREFFKPEKFKEWFVEKNVIYKNSPIAFLTKCGVQDIESGAFDKDVITGFAMHPLCEDMKSRGITYCGEDTMRIDVYLTHIYNHDLLPLEEIRKWVRTAVEYIENHSKNASEFKELFKKSKTMKSLKLPYAELDAEVDRNNAEWERLMKELGAYDEEDKEENNGDLPFGNVDGNPLESETIYEQEIQKIKINNSST